MIRCLPAARCRPDRSSSTGSARHTSTPPTASASAATPWNSTTPADRDLHAGELLDRQRHARRARRSAARCSAASRTVADRVFVESAGSRHSGTDTIMSRGKLTTSTCEWSCAMCTQHRHVVEHAGVDVGVAERAVERVACRCPRAGTMSPPSIAPMSGTPSRISSFASVTPGFTVRDEIDGRVRDDRGDGSPRARRRRMPRA